MQNQNGGYSLPWHATFTIALTVLLFLYLQNDMAKVGWWGQNWWPLTRIIGGFWLILLFLDRALGGPRRRARKQFEAQ